MKIWWKEKEEGGGGETEKIEDSEGKEGVKEVGFNRLVGIGQQLLTT